jgi:hypothetical protein
LRAPLLERRVVEERVRLRAQDAVREGDGSARRARRSMRPSRAAQELDEPSTSMRFVRQSSTVWRTIGMLHRHLDVAGGSVSPHATPREGRASRSSRACAGSAAERASRASARAEQRARAFQRHRVVNDRRGEQRLDQEVARAARRGSEHAPRAGSCAAVPSESTMASSLAAACSSKPKPRQMRLRSARPRRG